MQKKPNILWIFGDQHRAQALGFAGDPNARTPRLDAMAAEGVVFRNAVAGCPWCTPFRGALVSGLYPHRNVYRTPQAMDPSHTTIADAFKEGGYKTAWFGKWHLDGHNDMAFVPRERRGRFDTWIGYENNNAQYECWVHGHDEDGREDSEPLAEKLEGYETDVLTDHLLRYLGRDHEQSFFAVLSVQPPHDPHVAPPELMEQYRPEDIELRPNVPPVEHVREGARKDLAGYYAQIENLDANVGRVFDALRENGQLENTIVMFFSDHGDMHGSHGYKRKSSPWEESVCIPFIVRMPDGRSGECDAPMNHVDIGATSLGLCGLEVPESFMGIDFSNHLLPEQPSLEGGPRSAYLQQVHRKRFDCLNRTWRGVRTVDGWKYVVLEGQPFAMFNLNEDPYELNNLAFKDTHNREREELQKELAGWIERTGDSFELPEL